MKQFYILSKKQFNKSDIVRRYSFKTAITRDSYALLAKANNILADGFAGLGAESALFCKTDCFECLSPYKTAA